MLACIFMSCFSLKAQVSGSAVVCAGYLYTYTASVAGADSFIWSYPGSWAVISGSGTAQIQLLCTQNIGQVCVDAYGNGSFISQSCMPVTWGDGGVGWNVNVTPAHLCQCPPMLVNVVPNGTGGNCGGCGSGVMSPNIMFAIYDNVWPSGNYVGPADGVFQLGIPFTMTTYYVYQIDLTFGFGNEILIEGGLCPGNVNNTFTLNGPCMYVNLDINALPSQSCCVGDTVLLYTNNSQGNYGPYNWWIMQGNGTLLNGGSSDTVYCIVNAAGTISVQMMGTYGPNCPIAGTLDLNAQQCSSSISGDSIVCAGYTYTYNASIPGAVTYNWTLPNGWYGLTGQGSSSISATCNQSTGNICVEGFDAGANSVGTQCIQTQWGNGGSMGWDIYPSSFYYCIGQPRDVHFMILPNGTGSTSCPNGCGNGIQQPNVIYGLYDNSVPYPQFIAEIDGSWISMPPISTTYQVFYVDVSAGSDFPDAVIISGGCGSASINNTVQSNAVSPTLPNFTQFPDPACVGDTVLITQIENTISTVSWNLPGGLTILSYPDSNEVLAVVTNINAVINFDGLDNMYFCNTSGVYTLNTCVTYPSASFSAVTNPICPGTCTSFNNTSANSISYQWIFQGANPSSSTNEFPTNICYPLPGNFDVTLIATNSNGEDTLFIPGYITVLPYPPVQGIVQSDDTLISNQGFASYQWYYNGNLITGATNYFFIGTQNGDYNLISVDSNGCEVEAVYFNFMTGLEADHISILKIYPDPVQDHLTLELPSGIVPVSVSAFDMHGKKYSLSIQSKNSTIFSLKTADLMSGIYDLEVVTGKQIYHHQFIKQ